jgi:hypothetical protein
MSALQAGVTPLAAAASGYMVSSNSTIYLKYVLSPDLKIHEPLF